jgi:hypothetical protein
MLLGAMRRILFARWRAMGDSPHFHYKLDDDFQIVILCATCRSIVAKTDNVPYIRQFEEFHQCPALKDHRAELVLPTAEHRYN